MTTYEFETAADAADHICALDLLAEAAAALSRGESVSMVVAKHPASGVRVETLIIHAEGGAAGDVGRAGQAIGGDAAWGDYIETEGHMVHDESGEIFRLDGTLASEAA